MKVMPLLKDVEFADHLAIIRTSYEKNDSGNDTDFSIAFIKDGKFVERDHIKDMNHAIFQVCRYLWNTSQPVQYIVEEKEKEDLSRFEAIADES